MPTSLNIDKTNSIPNLRFNNFIDKWDEYKISDRIQVIDGDRGSFYPKLTDFTFEGYCLFINASNVTKNGFKFDELNFISKQKDEELRKGKLLRDDIVLTTRGTVGNIAYYDTNVPFENVRINSGMVLLRCDTNFINPNFLSILLSSSKSKKKIIRISFGSAQPQLTVREINKLKIIVPSIKEQIKIASVLSAIDNWIENLTQQKFSLEKYKKGMMQKIFSQEIRFKDEDGKDFPEWEEIMLKDIANFLKGSGLSKEDISEDGVNKCIRYGELYTDYREIISEVKSKTNIDKNDYILSEENDVLIPSSGETAIDIATASCVEEEGIILGGDINIVRFKDKNFGKYFTYYLSSFQKRQLARLAQGYSVVHLYANHFKTLKILLPSVDEQLKIVNYLSSIDELIRIKEQQIKNANIWKKGVMQNLFI